MCEIIQQALCPLETESAKPTLPGGGTQLLSPGHSGHKPLHAGGSLEVLQAVEEGTGRPLLQA